MQAYTAGHHRTTFRTVLSVRNTTKIFLLVMKISHISLDIVQGVTSEATQSGQMRRFRGQRPSMLDDRRSVITQRTDMSPESQRCIQCNYECSNRRDNHDLSIQLQFGNRSKVTGRVPNPKHKTLTIAVAHWLTSLGSDVAGSNLP